MMINFIVPRVAFVIKWDGTAVVSGRDVTGFQVNSPSGITCDDTSSSPSAMESRCSWEPSAVGQIHSLTVSAINCGSQQGPPSQSVSVNLQGNYTNGIAARMILLYMCTADILRVYSRV